MQVPNQICEAIISTAESLWIDLLRAAMALTVQGLPAPGLVNQLGRCTYPSRALSFDPWHKRIAPAVSGTVRG